MAFVFQTTLVSKLLYNDRNGEDDFKVRSACRSSWLQTHRTEVEGQKASSPVDLVIWALSNIHENNHVRQERSWCIILHAVRCSYAPSVLMCCVLFLCWCLNFSGKAQRPNVFWCWEQLYTQCNNECLLFFKPFLPLFSEIIQDGDIYDAAENQNNVFKT